MRKLILLVVVAGLGILAAGQAFTQEAAPAAQAEEQKPAVEAQKVASVTPRQASLSSVKGEVFIQKGDAAPVPAKKGDGLNAGDKVITKNGRAELTLDDGSLLKLKENAMLEIQDLNEEVETKKKNSIFKLLSGKLWAKAEAQKAGNFKVAPPAAIAGIRGTVFGITVNPDNSGNIYVFEGEVEAFGLTGEWATVIPTGRVFAVSSEGGQGQIRELTGDELKEWKKDFEEQAEEQGEGKGEEKKEKKEQKPVKTKGLGLDGVIGAVNLDGKMYYRVAFQPILKFGKLKAALNLAITWNDTGIKWDNTVDDYLNLLLYLQWAEKGERPLYFRFGNLDNATLGNGYIVNGYSNLTLAAMQGGYRAMGLEFDLDFKGGGVESVINNVFSPSVCGIRPFFRPLCMVPILERFVIGASLATDLVTGPIIATATVPEPSVQIYGVDMSTPIVGKWCIWFADAAQLMTNWSVNHGNGWATGFKGDIWILSYRVEYRNQDSDFISRYFSGFYETNKPLALAAHDPLRYTGYYGELGIDLFKFASINFSYEDSLDVACVSKGGYPKLRGVLTLNDSLFMMLKQKIVVSAGYEMTDMKDQARSQSILQVSLLYGVSSNVDAMYSFTQKQSPGASPITTSSVGTQIHF